MSPAYFAHVPVIIFNSIRRIQTTPRHRWAHKHGWIALNPRIMPHREGDTRASFLGFYLPSFIRVNALEHSWRQRQILSPQRQPALSGPGVFAATSGDLPARKGTRTNKSINLLPQYTRLTRTRPNHERHIFTTLASAEIENVTSTFTGDIRNETTILNKQRYFFLQFWTQKPQPETDSGEPNQFRKFGFN